MRKVLILFAALWLCSSAAFAQRTITGTITDMNGEALIGANIVVKGTAIGATTDFDGNYSIRLPEGSTTLVFSYTGYQTQEIIVGASNLVDIRMAEGVLLDAAIVTALGIEREEKALGYAVQELGGDEIDKARETNLVNSLSGKVAGVQINNSSNLGGSSRVLLRGASSILGENQPLFVVDGIPIDNANYSSFNQQRAAGGYDYGNMAQDINPDDIESISVLKGANAAALYGARAANGVILITTKKGKRQKNQPVGISVNSGFSVQEVFLLPNYQNQYGGGAGQTFGVNERGELIPDYGYDGSWGPEFNENTLVRHWDSYDAWDTENFQQVRPWVASPNNISNYFETGRTWNNNIALSGGSEDAGFRLSYTNVDVKGTQPNSTLKRNSLNFNGNVKLTDRLRSHVNANYVRNDGHGRPLTGYGESVMSQFNQWYQRQLDTDRLKNYKNPDGTQRTWNRNSADDPAPHYWDNPYWERYENVQNDSRDRIFGDVGLAYDIMPWMTLSGRAMTDYYTDRRVERIAVGGVRESRYSEDVRTLQENNYEFILNFTDLNVSNDISLNAFVGGNKRVYGLNTNLAATQGGLNTPGFYNLSNSASEVSIIDNTFEKVVNSVFASASFGFKNFLYVDLTARNDWSSTLPAENNSYFYPSVSSSFVFSELLPRSNVLSFGKLRASWAQVGNDTDPYRLANTYFSLPNFRGSGAASLPNAQNNPNLRPENTTSFEVGTQLNFLRNRIRLDVTYYNSVTEDLIFNVSQSGASGFTSAIRNAGKVENKGIEVMLNFTPIQTAGGLRWDIGLNYAKNDNRVVELADGIDNIRLASLFGVSVEARPGERYGTLMGFDYLRDDNGNRLVNANGTYARTSTVVPLGSVLPDFVGGISTGLSFGGFSISGLIDFQSGGALNSLSNQWGKYSGMLDETVANNIREDGIVVDGVYAPGTMIDGVDVSGQQNQTELDAQTHFFVNQGFVVHAADVYDASFVKLRELRVSYMLPTSFISQTPFTGATISLVGRNLAILSKNVPNIDPQAAVSSGNIQGFEGGQLPSERSIGVNLSFRL
jgi:TonB-linked SusC/RagA family outer membrane protein